MSNPRPIGLSSAMLLAMLAALGSAALVVIGGFANPMTAKSDLIVAGDAGTATRLAAAGAADGAVLTVAGNTLQWAAASGSSLPVAAGAGAIPVSTGAGTTYAATEIGASGTVLTSDGTDAVWATAPGAWTVLTASDLSLRNGTRGTVALATGRLDFTVDGVAAAYYDGTARTAPRAYVAIPTTATDVVLTFRLYTRTSGSAQTYTSVVGLLRSGSDDTAAPSVASAYYGSGLTMVSLPGTAHYNDGTRFYAGEFAGSGAYGTGGTGGVAWPANGVVNTSWLGVRWKDGRIGYGVVVAPADVPPDPEDYLWSWPAHASQWAGPPSLAVLALEQTGGTPSAQSVTAEARVYYR